MIEKNKKIIFRSVVLGLVVGLVMTTFFVVPSISRTKESPASTTAKEISYPLTQFADGKARHFEFKTADGKIIRYFIIRSSDGVIRAAFDACDVCWPSGKGYYQDGDVMVCRNCGRRFPSSQINVITGGCNPTALNRKIGQTQVTIQVKDILEGRQYFNF